MPEETKVNDVWLQASATHSLTLPSGQTCVARRIGIDEVLSAGVGDQMDTLTSYIMREHIERVRGPQDHKKKAVDQEMSDQDVEKLLAENPDIIKGSIFMFDRLLPIIVVKPKVLSHVRIDDSGETHMIPLADRETGVVYTDAVGLEDKVFLFEWSVGRLPDVNFRQEPQRSVAPLANVETVQLPTEHASRPSNRSNRRRKR